MSCSSEICDMLACTYLVRVSNCCLAHALTQAVTGGRVQIVTSCCKVGIMLLHRINDVELSLPKPQTLNPQCLHHAAADDR